jgi:hypothetical protein
MIRVHLFLLESLAAFAGSYTVQVIPPPSGLSPPISMIGINNAGQVAGTGCYLQCAVDGQQLPQAFIASPSGSVLIPLPGPFPVASTNGQAINNQGEVVGTQNFVVAGGVGFTFPFIGTGTAIGTPSSASPSYGTGINDAGQIAGITTVFVESTSTFLFPAFIGTASAITPIPSPAGWTSMNPSGINSSGQIVGYGVNGSNTQGTQVFMATASSATPVPFPPSGGSSPYTSAGSGGINDAGLVVGTADSATASAAFIGTAAGTTVIPMPPGATFTSVSSQSINNSGVVVGASDRGGWIWDSTSGARLLNTYVTGGWNITNGISISNNGLILAQGSLNDGPTQYVELIPSVASSVAKVGIFRGGFYWLLDVDGNRQWDDPPDQAFAYGGIAGDVPITGDWTGDGHTKVGIYRAKNGLFILDTNGDEVFDSGDAVYKFLQNVGGPQPGDVPVVGDWNGSGTSKIGIVRDGFLWLLDLNGDGVYEPGTDLEYVFGGAPGDIPVVGDWTGTGTTKIGVLRDVFLWLLDANGNGTWDGTAGGDFAFAFGGIPGDVPVVGDWTGDGVTKVGMFRAGFLWVLDSDDPGVTNATGQAPIIAFAFGGVAGDVPIVGKWFAPPASITPTGGTPQSAAINTAFAAPLALQVMGIDGYPVSGVTMGFSVPMSGASATFVGSQMTAVTNLGGVTSSAILTANGTTGGPYNVTATIQSCGFYPGCPGSATPANFSLTNTSTPALRSPHGQKDE